MDKYDQADRATPVLTQPSDSAVHILAQLSDPDSSMPVAAPHAPAIILRLLARLGIAAEVTQQPGHGALQTVQGVLLEDAGGTVLVLLACDQLLDLARLQTLSGRSLQAISPARRQRMLDKHQLTCMPALPPLTRSPCWYEQSLLQQPSLLLASGQPGVLLQLTSRDFRRLLGQAHGACLGLPLSAIPVNRTHPDQDFAQIRSAINNTAGGSLEHRLDTAMRVPPLTPSTQRILKLRLDPDATVDDIGKVVESDPALADLLLSCTSAPIFSTAGKARSVEDAMVRVLGFELGCHLALGLAIDKRLRRSEVAAQGEAAYLRQLLYTTSLMQTLSRMLPQAQHPEAGLVCLCGVLHNIGYRLLAQAFPQRFAQLCQQLDANPHAPHACVEQQLLGITREQLGSWLMRNWDLPAELAIAVRHQHDPDYSGPHALYANLLCLSLQLLATRGIGNGPPIELPPALFARLGIGPEQAAQAVVCLPPEVTVEALVTGLVAASGTRAAIDAGSLIDATMEQL